MVVSGSKKIEAAGVAAAAPIVKSGKSRQTRYVQTVRSSLLLLLLLACSAKQSMVGWNYRPAHGAHEALLSYNFGDSENTKFIGECDGGQTYFLTGGDYPLGTSEFTLTVDNRSWTLPSFHRVENRCLFAGDGREQAISHAQRRIVFQVGEWRRELKPGPLLRKFAADCK
jgi:hypothetical protein